MSLSASESPALPLQLRIEAKNAGMQRLAYLPTTGPSMDFYYLNYRPIYKAGESNIDFWMMTPKGTPAPKTGSLELYDEFGKVRLAVLVPEGTEIPQETANKNEPFMWKSWAVPKTLKSDFDFSEKFRVVLRTSDSKSATTATTAAKMSKRWFEPIELMVRGKNKHVLAPDNANTLVSSEPTDAVIVQDRQFRITGLQATPGGKPNPAKVNISSVPSQSVAAENSTSVPVNSDTHTHTHTANADGNGGSNGQSNIRIGSGAKVSSASSTKHALSLATLVAIVMTTFFDV
ncbi:hypothetical protein BGZ58_011272 [Dissophora ornata]|nr:hypothetical protein BGZ58_011272 [Dissophora ornata]